jgi:hypothetical protein
MIEGVIGSIFSSAVYDLIKGAARDALKRHLGEDIEEMARDQAIKAYQEAAEEWLIELIDTFHYLGFEEEEIRQFFEPYQVALPKFLIDEEVAAELLRPFTDEVERPSLDGAKLIQRWEANGFPDLPAEFPTKAACSR